MYRFKIVVLLLFISVVSAKAQNSCENIDFSMGNFTNWVGKTGYCCPINLPYTGIVTERHTIMTDTLDTDPYTGYQLKLIPPGHKYSARLGNSDVNAEAESLSYTLTVDDDNALFIYKFAVVLQDPGHPADEQPRFQIRVKDQYGQVLDACTDYQVVAAISIPGFKSYYDIRWRDWTTVGLNLLPYKGQTVTIELMTGDCYQAGHFGYAYFVAQCSPMELAVNYCLGSTVATLIAPEGFDKYKWSNGATTQTITVSNPVENAIYNCTLTSVTGCVAQLSTKIRMTVASSDFDYQSDCSGNVNFTNKSTVNIGDIDSYLWDFGDGNTSTNETPTHTYAQPGEYDVKLRIKTLPTDCTDSITKKVLVGISPDLTANDISICYGKATLTATSNTVPLTTFVWYNDSTYKNIIHNGSTFVSSILTNDTIFYVAAINGNCITKKSVKVLTTPPPVVVAMPDQRICYGDAITLSTQQADGTISWNVSNTTVQPLATQQYAVTASRPPCPDVTDMVTITVGDSLYIEPPTLPAYDRNRSYSQQLSTNAPNGIFSANGLPSSFTLNTDGKLTKISSILSNLGTVNFTVTVTDNYGCQTTMNYILNGNLSAPQVFSPDGDGINDHFMKGYQVVIFDRLGVRLFGGDDGWDGTYKGKIMPNDTYFYVIFHKDSNNKEVKTTGYISILKR